MHLESHSLSLNLIANGHCREHPCKTEWASFIRSFASCRPTHMGRGSCECCLLYPEFSVLTLVFLDNHRYYFCKKCPCKSLHWKYSNKKDCDDCGHRPMEYVLCFS